MECLASSHAEGWRWAGLLRTHAPVKGTECRIGALELHPLEQRSSHLNVHPDSWGAGDHADLESVRSGCGLRICISHRLPGAAAAAGVWTPREALEECSRKDGDAENSPTQAPCFQNLTLFGI